MRNGSKASELKGGRGGRAHGGDLGNEHIKIVTVPTSQSIVTCFFLYLTRGFCMTCGLSVLTRVTREAGQCLVHITSAV